MGIKRLSKEKEQPQTQWKGRNKMTLITYESEEVAPLLLDYEDTPDEDDKGNSTHAFEKLINAVAKAQWDIDMDWHKDRTKNMMTAKEHIRLLEAEQKQIYKDEADWLEKWLLNFTSSSADDKIDCLKKVKIRIKDLRKLASFDKLTTRYVLLAKNQTPPENDWNTGSELNRGWKIAIKDMLTPVLQPDGTYRVWAAVTVTKERLERMNVTNTKLS